MDPNDLREDPLRELTDDERLVLSEICTAFREEDQRSLTALEIKDRLHISEGEVRRRLGNIYEKLNITGSDNEKRIRLIFRYCLDREEPPQRKSTGLEVPLQGQPGEEELKDLEEIRKAKPKDEILQELEDLEQRIKSEQQQPEGQGITEPPPAGRLQRSTLWVVLAGVVGIAGLVVLLILIFGRDETAGQGSTTPETAFALVQPTNTIQPSPVTEALEPASETPEFTPVLSTPTDSLEVVPSATYTQEPTPSQTPSPTIEITPAPTALFQTSFENGMPDGMELVYGEVNFVDEKLVAQEPTLLSIGSETWKNYEVEYETRKHTACWGLKNNGVATHSPDPDNLVIWSWNYCESAWFIGDWNLVEGTRQGNVANPGVTITIKLVAEDGNFTVYINNRKRTTYFNENYLQGKVYILLSKQSVVDNIRVSPLP